MKIKREGKMEGGREGGREEGREGGREEVYFDLSSIRSYSCLYRYPHFQRPSPLSIFLARTLLITHLLPLSLSLSF